ncbi:MAG: sugar porter family MFS transporter [Bacteroidales bacterium]
MKYNLKYVAGISLISALAGFLFGYDWVVIGGAKPFYERFFDITGQAGMQGLGMSAALIGCVAGAIFSGWISERTGRKVSLVVAGALFMLSALGTGVAVNFGYFIGFRILGGIGIGMASAIAPIYIAEVSPPEYRGRFVSLNQLNIVIGILCAQIVNYLIAKEVPQGATDQFIRESWNGQMGWRWMFWAEAAPSVIFLILLYFIPESPRWLAGVSRWEKSSWILQMIGGEEYALAARKEIEKSLVNAERRHRVRFLFRRNNRMVVLIGIVLAVFQQWCGINVVFNYAEEVFSAAGYGVTELLFNIIITGAVNLVFTFLAIWTVDRWGRRRLMMIGSAGLALLYLLLGGAYLWGFQGLPILIIVILSIALYAMTLAPVTWVVLSEIFPNRIRGVAMAAATTMLWVASSILVVTFPFLNRGLDAYGTFWVYSGICVAGFLFIRRYLPETKGSSLEQLEILIGKEASGKSETEK